MISQIYIAARTDRALAGERVGKADSVGLGDGFGISEVHPLIAMQGVAVADMGDEGHETGQEEDQYEQ